MDASSPPTSEGDHAQPSATATATAFASDSSPPPASTGAATTEGDTAENGAAFNPTLASIVQPLATPNLEQPSSSSPLDSSATTTASAEHDDDDGTETQPLLSKPPKQAHFQDSTLITIPSHSSSANSPTSPSPRTFTAPPWHKPPSRRPSFSSTSPTRHKAPPKTLREVTADLRSLLRIFLFFVPTRISRLAVLIPSPVRRVFRAMLHQVAMALHKRGVLASSMLYDVNVFLWKVTIDIFFREIRSRGAWKIPHDGAILFVCGPHHNQFLDPLLLMSEVRREAGRRVSFIVAEASMQRAFVGTAARIMQSIPVARAQDSAKPGAGTIYVDSEDPTLVIGVGTKFTSEVGTRNQIMLGKAYGTSSVEVAEVLSDDKCRLKKEFPRKATEQLKGKTEGVPYKVIPYIDLSNMYSSVYQKLKEGGCIGIFPEGGSHDRTDLLPLKAGVSIMALGALASNPDLKLRIVPVGLSYFHPHKFRSRAVVEFGSPVEVPTELVMQFEKGGEDKRVAIGNMMELVVDGLKSVTVRAPDYETLMLIQATRRLYRPPGQHLTIGQIVELNKRFIAGYEVYKDEPQLIELTARVKEYNTLLRYMGLKDHQIERVERPFWRTVILLLYRVGLVLSWGVLALPGVVLNSPIFIAAKIISRKKAKEALAKSSVKIKGNDVLGSWKVLVALGLTPALYTVYAIGAVFLAFKLELPRWCKIWAPIATILGLPMIGYSALRFGEVGMDVYKSLRPLFLSAIPGNEKQLNNLRSKRASLQRDISEVVNKFGPQLFEDFQATRIVHPTAEPAPPPVLARRRSTYGPQGQNTFLTHPMSWVDEYIFGWSQAQALRPEGSEDTEGATHSGYVSGYTTDEPGDYDDVIHILSREQDGSQTLAPETANVRSRRGSRSARSRSALDLTALDGAIAGSGRPAVSRQSSKASMLAATALEEKSAGKRRESVGGHGADE
ncbi:glycerol-3-phosphate O-acyltransferase / dihydroxyacetone phosphate acyltransferase [Pseudohyphozyma bogoriensis]|nr:glycerol-3-phosphate O-acyltransferase / dihydroxyacetone phosphate acyltransferase [Pseudohyphozyma bogoriensis]